MVRRIPLPSQNWGVAVNRDRYIVFTKLENDLSHDAKIVIEPDMIAKIWYKKKVLQKVQLDPKREGGELEDILKKADKFPNLN